MTATLESLTIQHLEDVKTLSIQKPGLDPVTATFIDYGPGQGQVVVTCFGQAWSYYFGGMGQRRCMEFVASTSEGYFATKLESCWHSMKRGNLTKMEKAHIGRISEAVRRAALMETGKGIPT